MTETYWPVKEVKAGQNSRSSFKWASNSILWGLWHTSYHLGFQQALWAHSHLAWLLRTCPPFSCAGLHSHCSECGYCLYLHHNMTSHQDCNFTDSAWSLFVQIRPAHIPIIEAAIDFCRGSKRRARHSVIYTSCPCLRSCMSNHTVTEPQKCALLAHGVLTIVKKKWALWGKLGWAGTDRLVWVCSKREHRSLLSFTTDFKFSCLFLKLQMIIKQFQQEFPAR